MEKKFLTLFMLLYGSMIVCQIPALPTSQVQCLTPDDNIEWSKERIKIVHSGSKNIQDFKYVKFNIHFILRNDGTGNFNEFGDNQGNSLTGYQFAIDITKAMNSYLSYNTRTMDVPGNPNHPTPSIEKNFRVVLDAVYFHRDDNMYNAFDAGFAYDNYGQNKESVFNIFIFHQAGAGGGAFASELSCFSTYKYVGCRNYYRRYTDFLAAPLGQDDYSWVMHGLGTEMLHEIGHLLGLSHTVRYNWATPCPTASTTGFVDPSCDDGCPDTPTAWEIADNTATNTNHQHPACGWLFAWPGRNFCSYNLMDYNGNHALTPCQVGFIHDCLEIGLTAYMVCHSNRNNSQICAFSYPKLAYYGKDVLVDCTNSNYPTIDNNKSIKIFFDDNAILNSFIVGDNSDVEFIAESSCN